MGLYRVYTICPSLGAIQLEVEYFATFVDTLEDIPSIHPRPKEELPKSIVEARVGNCLLHLTHLFPWNALRHKRHRGVNPVCIPHCVDNTRVFPLERRELMVIDDNVLDQLKLLLVELRRHICLGPKPGRIEVVQLSVSPKPNVVVNQRHLDLFGELFIRFGAEEMVSVAEHAVDVVPVAVVVLANLIPVLGKIRLHHLSVLDDYDISFKRRHRHVLKSNCAANGESQERHNEHTRWHLPIDCLHAHRLGLEI